MPTDLGALARVLLPNLVLLAAILAAVALVYPPSELAGKAGAGGFLPAWGKPATSPAPKATVSPGIAPKTTLSPGLAPKATIPPSSLATPAAGTTGALGAVPKQDSDKDGVVDLADACPSVAGSGGSGCPPCKLDTDGKDPFEAGKVGRFVENTAGAKPLGFKMGKDGKPEVVVGIAPAYLVEWLVEDACGGAVLNEARCDAPKAACSADLATLVGAGSIAPIESEKLEGAECVVEPSKGVAGGSVVVEKMACPCGCSAGACLAETDTDKDGKPDCTDDDDDGDGVGDAKDDCPLQANPKQEDPDKDGKGNPCDPDDDGDGCYDSDDKSPLVASGDPDKDGTASDCDPCPFDVDDDKDQDGLCADKDDCPSQPNPKQDDVDADGVGDACDCSDVLQGPNEAGVDCGGVCAAKCLDAACAADADWCGADLVPIRLRGKHDAGLIDVVFVPDYRYGSLAQFQQDAATSVRDAFRRMGELTDVAFPADLFDRFNFYYYAAGPLDGKVHDYLADAGASCAGEPPATFSGFGGTVAPFRDSTVILCPLGTAKCWGCSTLGPGTDQRLNVEAPYHRLLLHESGHGIFSLEDEYCGDTWYDAEYSPNNIFLSKDDCEDAAADGGWTGGACAKVCAGAAKDWTIDKSDKGVALWRYDDDAPDPDLMIACAAPEAVQCGANYRYHEADAARVDHVLANWVDTDTPAVLARIRLTGDGAELLGVQLLGAHPDLGHAPEHFRARVLAPGGALVLEYPLSDPRIHLGEPSEVYEEGTLSAVAPVVAPLGSLQLVEPRTGSVLAAVDLAPAFVEFCAKHPEHPPCKGEALPGVKVPGVVAPSGPLAGG